MLSPKEISDLLKSLQDTAKDTIEDKLANIKLMIVKLIDYAKNPVTNIKKIIQTIRNILKKIPAAIEQIVQTVKDNYTVLKTMILVKLESLRVQLRAELDLKITAVNKTIGIISTALDLALDSLEARIDSIEGKLEDLDNPLEWLGSLISNAW